ncbi:MAG: 3-dehydroquinate synthase family protein [Planctomycetota bacterium]
MTPAAVRVELPDGRGYDVRVSAGAAVDAAGSIPELLPKARRVHVVVDAKLPRAFVDAAMSNLRDADLTASSSTIDPSESVKTLETLERVLADAAAARLDRGDCFLALGGGIVGDVTGFAAASYKRGAAVVQCPTTLLAMVDASVGGKTGVNLDAGGRLIKNAVGAFFQPVLVAAELRALDSLPDREFSAGLAECLKHGMIGGAFDEPGLFAWIVEHAETLRSGDDALRAELIARNVAVKAAVVRADERETASSATGGRAILNLGHTFAHAMETLPEIGLLHGEAVGLGLIAARAMSEAMGLSSDDGVEGVRAACRAAGLPTEIAGLPGDSELLDRMGDDKKAQGGVLRVIAPLDHGVARVIDDPDPAAIVAGWSAIRN